MVNVQGRRQSLAAFPGDKAWTVKKLHHPWTGPYTVVKRLSDITYRIAHPTSKRQRQVVHFDRLKRCRERQRNTSQSSNRERSPSAEPEQPPPQRRQFGEQLTIVVPDDALTPGRTPVAPPVAARPLRCSTGPRAPVDRLKPMQVTLNPDGFLLGGE